MGGDTGKLSTTVVRSAGLVQFPWLYISCRDAKRTVGLSKVQPPFTLELHQALSKHNPVDLILNLFWRTGLEERSFQSSDRPICKLRLISSSDNRVLDAGFDSRSERSRGVDEHLAY